MDEIEKFLRQAAARRRAQQPTPARPPAQSPSPRPPAPIQYVQPAIIEPEIIEPDILDGDDVAEHVQHHLDARAFSERASHLGEEVGLADDHLDAHLHQKFDHRLGQLQDTSSSILQDAAAQKVKDKTMAETPAGSLFTLLRSPQSIRQAVILSEVLQRPEYRW